jgi:hypothetical protein
MSLSCVCGPMRRDRRRMRYVGSISSGCACASRRELLRTCSWTGAVSGLGTRHAPRAATRRRYGDGRAGREAIVAGLREQVAGGATSRSWATRAIGASALSTSWSTKRRSKPSTIAAGCCEPMPSCRPPTWHLSSSGCGWSNSDCRSCKSLLDTRPIYHHCDDTIRGDVFCWFLACCARAAVASQGKGTKVRMGRCDSRPIAGAPSGSGGAPGTLFCGASRRARRARVFQARCSDGGCAEAPRPCSRGGSRRVYREPCPPAR